MIKKSWIWHLALVMVVAMIIVGERAELGEGCSEVPECFQLLEAWGQTAVEAGMQISGLTSTWPPAFGPLRELLDVRDAHLASLREIAVLLLSSIHHDHYASYPHLPHPHHHSHSHHSHHSQHSQHDDHQHSHHHHHHSHTHSSHAEKKFDVGEEVVVLDADVADLAPNFGALLDHNQLHLADGHALERDVVVPQQDQASSLFGHHHHEESDQVHVLFEGDEEERELDSSSQPPIADPSSIFEQQARRAAAAEEEDEQQQEEEEVILFPTWESCSMARHWNVGEKALRLSELLYWIERSALAEWQEMTQTDTYLTSAIKAARFLCLAEGEHFVPSYSAPSSASAFAQQHYPAAQYHHQHQGPFDDNAGNDVRFVKIELDNGASMSNITQALAQAIRDAIWSLQQNDPTAELVLDQESLEELAAELLYLQSEEDD